MRLWERRPDNGPYHIQMYKHKRAKGQNQT